jgi:hypothetical protein
VHREARVDRDVYEDDRAPRDLRVEVLEEPDALLAPRVAGQLDEVEVVVNRDSPREVADEGDAALQGADEQRLRPLELRRQLPTELADTCADLVRIEEDLADALVELDQRAQEAFRNPYRVASRSKSRS